VIPENINPTKGYMTMSDFEQLKEKILLATGVELTQEPRTHDLRTRPD
jgi:hypothetical protein